MRLKRTGREDQEIDPLRQYGAYAFIPYTGLNASAASNRTPQPITTNKKSFYLTNTSSWTYCGPLLTSTNLPPSFHTWSCVTVSDPCALSTRLLPLLSFLKAFLEKVGAHNYWLTIRATKPTHEYDMPRWHVDENFFNSPLFMSEPQQESLKRVHPGRVRPNGRENEEKKRRWKLCTTLLGPPTLFLADNSSALGILRATKNSEKRKIGEHTCTSIRCLGCSTYADTIRTSLATSLPSNTTNSPVPNEVAFFRLGDEEGAVHSEPQCDEDRIFVNVVPGEEGELRDLMGRWGMEFPRAWSFGVPVGFNGFQERESGDEDEAEGMPMMNVNVAGDYGKWLEKEGFEVNKVFGHGGADATHSNTGRIG